MHNEITELTKIGTSVRGISPKTFETYQYNRGPEGQHVVKLFDASGKFVSQKIRYKDKTFAWTGEGQKAVPLGLNMFRNGGKRITITIGELDCLSIAEALDCKYPTISLLRGAENARSELKNHIEYINSFDNIVLAFDNTPEGKKAIAEATSLFTPGKVSTIDLGPYKDFNEVLTKQGKNGVLKYYYEIKKHAPNGIVNANEGGFDSLMEDNSSDEVYYTQYENLTISKGAITTFVSGSGMGKSTIVREIGHELLTCNELRIGHVALEENNQVSKRAYLGLSLNENIIGKARWAEFKEKEENVESIKDAYAEIIEPGNLFLYNHFGSLNSDDLISKLRYLAVGAECDIIILDHISIVVSGLEDLGDNERRTIDVLMTKLRSLVEETGVGMILVSHLKRTSGDKGHEDGIQVSLSHLRGSGSIAQLSDKVIGLEGNQQDEENKLLRTLRCLKDREDGENVGILGTATYNPEIGRLLANTEIDIDDPNLGRIPSDGSNIEEGFKNETVF